MVHTLEPGLLVDIGTIIGTNVPDGTGGQEQLRYEHMIQVVAAMARLHAFGDIFPLPSPSGSMIGMSPCDLMNQFMTEEGICDGKSMLHGQVDQPGPIGVGGRMSKPAKRSSGLWYICAHPGIKIPQYPAAVLGRRGTTQPVQLLIEFIGFVQSGFITLGGLGGGVCDYDGDIVEGETVLPHLARAGRDTDRHHPLREGLPYAT
jgi:hypothetical protein